MRKREFIPTEKDIAQVERMAKIGMTTEHIAIVLGRGKKSLFRDFEAFPELREAYERGAKAGVDEVSNTAYQMAISGKVPAMTMFWLKCRARWKEVHHVEHTGKLTLEEIVASSFNKNDSSDKNDEQEKED